MTPCDHSHISGAGGTAGGRGSARCCRYVEQELYIAHLATVTDRDQRVATPCIGAGYVG